jgi:hypothetical protein
MPICLIEKAAASLCSSAVEVIELEPHANREVPSACILAVLTTPIQMLSYPQELKEDPAITMSLTPANQDGTNGVYMTQTNAVHSQPKIDDLKPLLEHDIIPIHIQGLARMHEAAGLLLVDDLQGAPRRRRVAADAFLLHAGDEFEGQHLLGAIGRGHAGHEQGEDDEPKVVLLVADDAVSDPEHRGDAARDLGFVFESGIQPLGGPHAGVGIYDTCPV